MGGNVMQKVLKVLKVIPLHWLFVAAAMHVTIDIGPVFAQAIKNREQSPHLADLMNEAMQVHHTKLGLAGHAGNWALADYEARKIKETVVEIKEAIVDIQATSARWQRVPVGEMLTNIDTSLNSLKQAIVAEDKAKFDVAYNGLTTACNACHARAGQSQIKIMNPPAEGGNTFPDQDFSEDKNDK
jgi:cytochrome c553